MNIDTLVLDNDQDDLNTLKSRLKIKGRQPFFTSEILELINRVTDQPTVIVTDYYLDAGKTGVDVMRTILKIRPICHFIYMSSMVSVHQLMEIVNEGWGVFFVNKDQKEEIFIKELTERIEQAKMLLRQKITASSEATERAKTMQQKIAEALRLLEGNG